MSRRAAVLAVDGGNSKADLALVAADGTLLAAVHGPSISHQAVGLEAGMANLAALARQAADLAQITRAEGDGGPIADAGLYCLAGADYPEDVELLRHAIGALGLTESVDVRNDTFGALRAGTHRPWGVVLICGRGVNGAAIAPGGRTIRFDGVGTFSGDWGGGGGIGRAAIAAAVRSRDGRGPWSSLEASVPAFFGVASPQEMTKGLYLEQLSEHRITELAPLVFQAAHDGDEVARGIVDRLADELVAMAGALVRRLGLERLEPEVVLAGGVFKTTDEAFHDRLVKGILAAAPKADIHRLDAPPVLGAALLRLDELSPTRATPADVEARLRTALRAWAAGL